MTNLKLYKSYPLIPNYSEHLKLLKLKLIIEIDLIKIKTEMKPIPTYIGS